MGNVDIENGQNRVKKENRKNVIKIITLVLLCAGLFLLVDCGIVICALRSSNTNTRETAVRLKHGEWLSSPIASGEEFWFYFDLEKTTVVALVYAGGDNPNNASYFYAESDNFYDETKQLVGNGFETRELAAGKYYFRLHGLIGGGGLLGRRPARAMFLIVDDLPALPTGTPQKISSNTREARLESGYYTLDLTEERSDFTADAVMPEHLSHRVYFHYGENHTEESSFYFYNAYYDDKTNGVCSATITLPSGRTIVEVSTFVDDSRITAKLDTTIKYTVAKAAPGTVFDREVSALPGLPLGEELNMSEMFDNYGEFTEYNGIHGLISMHTDPAEDSVLSVRVKGFFDGSITVAGYYNTNPLNSVKRQSGYVFFRGFDEYIDDMTQSCNLPAGLNLIELRVYLLRDYSAEVFAASTIEFNISPLIRE